MRQIWKNIVLGFMLLTFMVSASGFRLIKHTCPMCEIARYSLYKQESCCPAEQIVQVPEQVSCCTIQVEHTTCSTSFENNTCCENESKLIVIEELVAPANFRVEALWVSLPPQVYKPDLVQTFSIQQLLDAFRHPPPPVFSGTDYVVYLQQLKIAHC